MRTLHFHPISGLHRPQWFDYQLHLPGMLKEPWFWVAVIFILMFGIVAVLAMYSPPGDHLSMPMPMFYP
jgi:hypothetical protein